MKSISHIILQSPLPRLEAEILLAHALQVDRGFLYSHSDDLVDESVALSLYQRRLCGEPIAYIVGTKEFWKSRFSVNKHVLIPRPETELLLETALSLFPEKQHITAADLGTGSGIIALSLAQERPHWDIIATDMSEEALFVARSNQVHLSIANVQFYQGSWCEALPVKKFDIIISNPPYIAADDLHLSQGDLRFEPRSALAAAENGLAAIQAIARQSKHYLKSAGFLLIEHGYDQATAVSAILLEQGYEDVYCFQDLAGLDRLTIGSFTSFHSVRVKTDIPN